ncbi:MAG: protein kinase [Actinomycetota bacterium]
MPPPVSDRFRLEVRLGRDGDIEEWLATDTSLDRPVLIRVLGPEASSNRRREFLEAVRKASAVSHLHLAAVYMVEEVEGGAYSVSEWTGGASLRARLEAGDTIEVEEFLSNASGLAAALATLHGSGVVHGGIDTGAITYTVAHPAKLGSFGRHTRGATTHDDVRSLSEVLEESLTGAPPGTSPPSELIDGLNPEVDRILREGRKGVIPARTLAEALAAAPTPRRPQPESTRPSRRLLLVAVALVVAAAGLVGLGRLFTPSGMPVPPPPAETVARLPAASSTTAPTTTTVATTVPPAGDVTVSDAEAFDPFGGGGENDELAGDILDDDFSTAWRTEVYLDPLPLLKAGVGVTVDVSGVPRSLDLFGVPEGASLELRWSEGPSDEFDDFVPVGRLVAQPGVTSLRLPPREDGTWLVWFTDLPEVDGDYVGEISELRFRE